MANQNQMENQSANQTANRVAAIQRKTKETAIELELNLDGEGKTELETSIPFLEHMLDLFAKHGKFDLRVKAVGDIEIDDHHYHLIRSTLPD